MTSSLSSVLRVRRGSTPTTVMKTPTTVMKTPTTVMKTPTTVMHRSICLTRSGAS